MYDVAATIARVASPVWKVTLPDRPRAKIFDFTKAQDRQFGVELIRFKFAFESLAQRCDSCGKRLASSVVLILIKICIRRISVVEHDVGPSRQVGDESKRRKDRLLRQIRHDAQPSKKGRFRRIEADGAWPRDTVCPDP